MVHLGRVDGEAQHGKEVIGGELLNRSYMKVRILILALVLFVVPVFGQESVVITLLPDPIQECHFPLDTNGDLPHYPHTPPCYTTCVYGDGLEVRSVMIIDQIGDIRCFPIYRSLTN